MFGNLAPMPKIIFLTLGILCALTLSPTGPAQAFFHDDHLKIRLLPFCPMAAREAALRDEASTHAYQISDQWTYELNFTCLGVVDGPVGRYRSHRFREHPPWADPSGRLAAEVLRLSEPPVLYAEFALIQIP
jgi:hypothetical protein